MYEHSVKAPRIYKVAAKVAKNVKEGKDSLKNLVYQEKHVNTKTLYALVVETCKKNKEIDDLLKRSDFLTREPRIDPWLAKILICEMLWGKNRMQGESKPVKTILANEQTFRELVASNPHHTMEIVPAVQKPRYVRVNTILTTVQEAIENFRDEDWILVRYMDKRNYNGFLEKLSSLQPNEFMVDIHVPDLLIFPPRTEFYRHRAYKSGLIILQDKASCLPVQLLNPPEGSVVMDMCAAPGMKTTQIASHLKNNGTVYAVEVDLKRQRLLEEMIEGAGATCVKTILKDVLTVTDEDCPNVEYILVDPSCTGSGITDRIEFEEPSQHDRMNRLSKLCGFQAKILRYALTKFPNVKRVVYSTCSINTEENEDIVRQVLETCRGFKLVDAKALLNNTWNNLGSDYYADMGKMCIYAVSEKDYTNGFFLAVFERLQDNERNQFLNSQLCKLYDIKFKDQTKFRKGREKYRDVNDEANNIEQIDEEKYDIDVGYNSLIRKTIRMKSDDFEADDQEFDVLKGNYKYEPKRELLGEIDNKKKRKHKLVNEQFDEELFPSKESQLKLKRSKPIEVDMHSEITTAECEESTNSKKLKKKRKTVSSVNMNVEQDVLESQQHSIYHQSKLNESANLREGTESSKEGHRRKKKTIGGKDKMNAEIVSENNFDQSTLFSNQNDSDVKKSKTECLNIKNNNDIVDDLSCNKKKKKLKRDKLHSAENVSDCENLDMKETEIQSIEKLDYNKRQEKHKVPNTDISKKKSKKRVKDSDESLLPHGDDIPEMESYIRKQSDKKKLKLNSESIENNPKEYENNLVKIDMVDTEGIDSERRTKKDKSYIENNTSSEEIKKSKNKKKSKRTEIVEDNAIKLLVSRRKNKSKGEINVDEAENLELSDNKEINLNENIEGETKKKIKKSKHVR